MKELEPINDITQLVNCLGKDGEELDREIRLMAALKLFDLGRISSGIAARLAGMERVEFLNICGQYDVYTSFFSTFSCIGKQLTSVYP